MIKDFQRSHVETNVSYSIHFDIDENRGYTFPYDEHGAVDIKSLPEPAQNNYNHCLEHPEEFIHYKRLSKDERSYRVPASGTCKCGNQIYLTGNYMGASECPHCGQWYNVFGQELLPPDQWEEAY